MSSLHECTTRESLEALLGPPRYAMEGHLYSSDATDESRAAHPDVVEVYEKDGCLIELWFKDGKVSAMTGKACLTSWEIVTGAIT
jgi:hypothetical protein